MAVRNFGCFKHAGSSQERGSQTARPIFLYEIQLKNHTKSLKRERPEENSGSESGSREESISF